MSEENGYQELDLENIDTEAPIPDDGKKVMQSGAAMDVIHEGDSDTNFVLEDEGGVVPQAEVEQEEQNKQVQEKASKRKGRAQQRIRKLNAERKELQERLDRSEKEKELLIRASQTSRIHQAKTQRDLVATRLQDLSAQQRVALENQDYDTQARLTQEIADATLRLRVLDYEANTGPRPTPQQRLAPQQQQQGMPGVPEAGQDWLEDNKWMVNPTTQEEAMKRNFTMQAADELVNRGLNPEDPDFYDELDVALEQFTAQAKQVQQQPTPQQETPRVSGSGRQTPTRRSTTNKVRLTKEDQEVIQELGISPQDYARQKMNMDDSGWSEIS